MFFSYRKNIGKIKRKLLYQLEFQKVILFVKNKDFFKRLCFKVYNTNIKLKKCTYFEQKFMKITACEFIKIKIKMKKELTCYKIFLIQRTGHRS